MSDWQPIKTAPKDETEIDLWIVRREYGTTQTFDGERVANARWYIETNQGQSSLKERWVFFRSPYFERAEPTEAHIATHWMPLPEPPETAP